MYIGKINGQTVWPGCTVEVAGLSSFNFRVLEFRQDSLKIRWLAGSNKKGEEETISVSLFRGILDIKIIEMPDEPHEPNRAFLLRKS